MQSIIAIIKSCLFIFSLFLLILVVGYLLPEPFSSIHVPVVVVALYILLKEHGRIVWYICMLAFFQEILFSLPIFGAILLASTISTLIAYWSHRFWFTNSSVYTGLSLGILLLVSYRICWYGYYWIISTIGASVTSIPHFSFGIFFKEFFVTESILLLLLLMFVRKKNMA